MDCGKESSEEEFELIATRFPIPVEMLEETYKTVRDTLQALAEKELAVGLFLQVKTALTIKAAAVKCYCRGKAGKRVVKVPGGYTCKTGC